MGSLIGEDCDLDWLAFAYASGALDPAAEAVFEERLDVDQSAREALAAAVGLLGVIVAARPPKSRFRLVRAAGLATLATAATLATVLILSPRPVATTPSTETVALAWSGLQGGEDFLAALDDAPEPLDEMSADEDAAPPSWLLEATRLHNEPTASGPGQGS